MKIFYYALVVSVGLGAQEISLEDVLNKMEKKWEEIETYTCTYETYQKKGDQEDKRIYEVKFKKPQWMRLKVLEGKNKGGEVVYNPETKKVRGRRGGLLKFIVLTLEPDDARVVSLLGYKTYHAGPGEIYRRFKIYREKDYEMKIESFEEEKTKGFKISVSGVEPSQFFGSAKENLWITEDFLPYKWENYNPEGSLILKNRYWDIKINVQLPEGTFGL